MALPDLDSAARRPRRVALCLAFGLLGLLGLPRAALAQRMVVDTQTFEMQARVGDAELKLNGAGLRAVAWFKAYAAGLYLAQKTAAAEQALAAQGPKRLQMRMMQDVPTVEFVKAFDKGVTRNTSAGDLPALKERMAQFDRNVTAIGQVKKGDVINLDFIPGTGLVLSVNGRVRGEPIPGADLYTALLRIFIGDKPTDTRLKASLLGAAWS